MQEGSGLTFINMEKTEKQKLKDKKQDAKERFEMAFTIKQEGATNDEQDPGIQDNTPPD